MDKELREMMCEIYHFELLVSVDGFGVYFYDPFYNATRAGYAQGATFEEAVRAAYAQWQAYVAEIPENMRDEMKKGGDE